MTTASDISFVKSELKRLHLPRLREELVLFAVNSCKQAMTIDGTTPEITCKLIHFPQRDGIRCEIRSPFPPEKIYRQWASLLPVLSPSHLAFYADVLDTVEKEDGLSFLFTFYR